MVQFGAPPGVGSKVQILYGGGLGQVGEVSENNGNTFIVRTPQGETFTLYSAKYVSTEIRDPNDVKPDKYDYEGEMVIERREMELMSTADLITMFKNAVGGIEYRGSQRSMIYAVIRKRPLTPAQRRDIMDEDRMAFLTEYDVGSTVQILAGRGIGQVGVVMSRDMSTATVQTPQNETFRVIARELSTEIGNPEDVKPGKYDNDGKAVIAMRKFEVMSTADLIEKFENANGHIGMLRSPRNVIYSIIKKRALTPEQQRVIESDEMAFQMEIARELREKNEAAQREQQRRSAEIQAHGYDYKNYPRIWSSLQELTRHGRWPVIIIGQTRYPKETVRIQLDAPIEIQRRMFNRTSFADDFSEHYVDSNGKVLPEFEWFEVYQL